MRFFILGSLGIGDEASHVTAPRGLPGTVFAMLLLNANQAVLPGVLTASLWPDSQPTSAMANLRQYMSRIRKFLHSHSPQDAARLRRTHGGYLLELRRDELDLTCFEESADAGRLAYDDGDVAAARRHLESALALWRGDICQGTQLGQGFEAAVRYWEERRLEASRLLLQTRLLLGEYDRATAEIHALVARDPFCEDLWAALMLALYYSHRRGEALNVYRVARRRFVNELGIEPTTRLQYLHQSILKDENVPKTFDWPLSVSSALSGGADLRERMSSRGVRYEAG